MALISLKQETDEDMTSYRPNQFGYGTEIYLDAEQCEALGITTMMRAGQPVSVRATGVVKRATEELEASTDSGGKDVSMCIQLLEIEVKPSGAANAKRAAEMLYGEDKDQ